MLFSCALWSVMGGYYLLAEWISRWLAGIDGISQWLLTRWFTDLRTDSLID